MVDSYPEDLINHKTWGWVLLQGWVLAQDNMVKDLKKF